MSLKILSVGGVVGLFPLQRAIMVLASWKAYIISELLAWLIPTKGGDEEENRNDLSFTSVPSQRTAPLLVRIHAK